MKRANASLPHNAPVYLDDFPSDYRLTIEWTFDGKSQGLKELVYRDFDSNVSPYDYNVVYFARDNKVDILAVSVFSLEYDRGIGTNTWLPIHSTRSDKDPVFATLLRQNSR